MGWRYFPRFVYPFMWIDMRTSFHDSRRPFGMRSNRPLKNRSALRSASSSLPRIRSGASSAAYRSTPQSLLLLALLVSRLRLVSHAPTSSLGQARPAQFVLRPEKRIIQQSANGRPFNWRNEA